MKKFAFLWFQMFMFSWLTTNAQLKFDLPALGYAYSALEPHIDARTMEVHHSKHHRAYVDNLNKALPPNLPSTVTIEELLKTISQYSDAIRNNAGGHYNHSLFWKILTPGGSKAPAKRLNDAIIKSFGSMDSLYLLMASEGAKRFGSGWVWLCVDEKKNLFVMSTPNQDNPLMDIAERKGKPVIGIDVWEHAYYLKYENRRGDYLKEVWKALNWDVISALYDAAAPKGRFEDWPTIVAYHKVMAQTFHPSEEGNLSPIKARHKELSDRAQELLKAPIPAQFDSKEIRAAVKKLAVDSGKLSTSISKGAKDPDITKDLNQLHDTFHLIVGLCSNEEHEDH